jgi:hypothetical protein
MNRKCKVIQIFLVVVALVLSACRAAKPGVMTDNELKKHFETKLSVGDSREKIEMFLKDEKWIYSFNQFEPRFEIRYDAGAIDTWYMKSGVGVDIYIDTNDKLKNIVVKRLATGI